MISRVLRTASWTPSASVQLPVFSVQTRPKKPSHPACRPAAATQHADATKTAHPARGRRTMMKMLRTTALNTVSVRVGWLRFRWNRNGRLCVQRTPFVAHQTKDVSRWGLVIICNCWTGQVVRFGATNAARCLRIWNHCSSVLGSQRNCGLTAC